MKHNYTTPRYTVLTEDCCCGHVHRHYGRAVDCLDRFEDKGIPAKLVETIHRFDPMWIDKHLCKRTSMQEMAAALQG